jgi:hypothetical protein
VWDKTASQWVVETKDESTWNANGNNASQSLYQWNSTSAQWIGIQKNESTYDSSGRNTLFFWYNWDLTNSEWIVASKDTSYYSEHTINSVPSITEKEIHVYPNPARDFIVVDLSNISNSATIEIYSMNGKLVSRLRSGENQQIAVRNLSKGLYLLRIYNNGMLYCGKFIVE